MTPTIRFTVLGIAQTKGSARAWMPKGGRRPIITNDNPKAKAWQERISAEAARALEQSGCAPFADGPVRVDVAIYLPRPKKFLTRKYAAVDVPHVTRPDADKLLRTAKDALSHVVYGDDGQVVDARVHKRYCAAGEMPRAEITVSAVLPTAAALFDSTVTAPA